MPDASQSACRTCRLRRKKCDKIRPVCGACRALDITCYSKEEQANRQHGEEDAKLIEVIQSEIKAKSYARREKRQAAKSMGLNGEVVMSSVDRQLAPLQNPAKSQQLQASTFESNANDVDKALASFNDGSAADYDGKLGFNGVTHEIDFVSKYMDYVFPFLFPYYRPAIFETGRSWLSSLLKRSRVATHAVVGVTTYFFTIALNQAYGSSYDDCADWAWSRLGTEAQECFEGMHRDLERLLEPGSTATAFQKVQTMEDIIFVLVFETVIGRPDQ
jgi:C6 transcription factor Pro1